ncbi:hypothetical protein ELQ05_08250, partial [Campylobacter sp. US53]
TNDEPIHFSISFPGVFRLFLPCSTKSLTVMKIYDDKHIKNVVFVGAHNSGITTLAETMLFEAGLLNRRGTVGAKNT